MSTVLKMQRMEKALLAAKARIEGEDYVGTCSCLSAFPPNKRKGFICSCKVEHDAILSQIDAALAPVTIK